MSERVRFQADEDLETQIIKGLRRRQPLIEFETIPSVGLRGKPDLEVLAFAAQQERVIVSHDLKTMPTHFGAFLASGQHSSGLILIPQNNIYRASNRQPLPNLGSHHIRIVERSVGLSSPANSPLIWGIF